MPTTTRDRFPPSRAGTAARAGRTRWVVAGSLLTGLVAAGVLTLVVVAGAREHVVTGSALLGLALGWAVLAVASSRWTDQPQRWALVPATAMAATGLALLAVAPGDAGLTAAGWVWPPALLVLALWSGRRVRRSLAPRRGRRLLHPIVALMVLAAVGGMAETLVRASQGDDAMPGRGYDVGGRRLHLDCTGTGSPTVVLLGGLGSMSSSWARIAPVVGRTTRVCAYDRAGQGWSDDLPHVQDGIEVAADLHALLDRAGEDGPFVLAGHSTGGSYAMVYAAQYPGQVAGMALLDPSDPYRSTAGSVSPDAGAPALVAIAPGLARLGLGRLAPSAAWSALPEPAAGQLRAFAAGPRGWRNQRDEYAAMPAVFGQAQRLTGLGSAPLVVVTTRGSPHAPGFSEAHGRMAALSTNSGRREADVSHVGLLDEERGAAVAARAVDDVVRAARTGTPVPSR
ncbi:alpha/beta fold hydrolase [Geodermatophilus sp. SYSU D00705]